MDEMRYSLGNHSGPAGTGHGRGVGDTSGELPLDQHLQERAVAAVFAGALGGAEEGDGFAGFEALGEGLDLWFLREHFLEVTLAVDVPAQGEALALAIRSRMELDAGGEVLVPRVPG